MNMANKIKSEKFKLSDLLRSVNDLHDKLVYGCGNHGCVIKPPAGMGTNAICRCRPKHIAAVLGRLADAVESAGTSWPDEKESEQCGEQGAIAND
jgi:hypothetical protein